mmetsp:Transcript_18366/g.22906  ORF Transcript_18366/g.22906 Transcript_18366/m.22906 type:complete len:81 (-) Transcript_18366:67-309(-)
MAGGFAAQTGKPMNEAFQSMIKGINGTVVLVFTLICLVFYCIAIFISFRAYREFKYSFQMRAGPNSAAVQNPMSYGSIKD